MNRKMYGFHRLLLLCTLVLTFTTTFAAVSPQTNRYLEVIAAGSLSKVNADGGSIQVSDIETDRLTQNNGSWNSWGGQLGLGSVFLLFNAQRYSDNVQWFPAIEPEINVYYSTFENNGDLTRYFNIIPYTEFDYDMTIHSTRLMLDAALTVASWRQYSGYIIAGIGNSWNRLDYSDHDPSCSLDNLRLGQKSTQFVWEAGLGVAYAINNTSKISFQYLYTDFGDIKTGSGTGVLSGAKFDFTTQAFLLGLHVSL